MGIADFYLNVSFDDDNNDSIIESLYNSFANKKIFTVSIIDRELTIESQFDYMIPAVMIIFNLLQSKRNLISSLETHGITVKYNFNSLDEFMMYMFTSNKEQLISYYSQLGFFAIDSKKYYKVRTKLKKYYQLMQ